jgi:hypothetical protein
MKKAVLFFSLMFLFDLSYAQTELKGTMGINFLSFPSVQDYINEGGFTPTGYELGTFSSAVIFTAEGGLFLQKNFELSLEIPCQIYSYNETIEAAGQYELAYNSFMPSVMAYYVLTGNGYNFKFGAGAGPRFISVTEKKKWQGTEESFSAVGFGGLLRAEANTALAENFFANIGFDLRYDLNGEPENGDGGKLENILKDEAVNFNTFSLGVKLGVSYIFGGSN